jgi:hypothetical protein
MAASFSILRDEKKLMERIFSFFSFFLPYIFLILWCLLQLIFKQVPADKTNEQTGTNTN